MSAANPNVGRSRRRAARSSRSARTPATTTAARSPSARTATCTSALGDGGNANDVGASHIEPGGNAQNLTHAAGQDAAHRPAQPGADARQPRCRSAPTASTASRRPIRSRARARCPRSTPIGFRNPYRFAFDRATGDLILADVGQNNIEEIDRITLGGNYGWAVKEGDFLFNRTGTGAGTIGASQPGRARRADRSDRRARWARWSTTTATASRSPAASSTAARAIPELFGKYVFGDLALRACAAARRRPAVLRRPRDRRDQGVPAAAVRRTTCCPTG